MNYVTALERLDLQPAIRGPWAVVGRTRREQGWKLHVSTIPVQARSLLEVVVPLLHERDIPFKIAREETVLHQLNEGALGATQVGKFLTAYPQTNRAARDLAVALRQLTEGFSGPVIVTDLRLGDVVYARYGPFSPRVLRDRLGHTTVALRQPNGTLVPHEYTVPFEAPRGRVNPFRDLVSSNDSEVDPGRLFGPGYLILDLIRSSPRGSVFLALDARDGHKHTALRVLKEGRQHCFSDDLGRDMRSRLRHQAAMLEALRDHVTLPTADPYFEVAENGYLPLGYIAGADLHQEVRGAWGRLARGDQRQIIRRLLQLSRLLSALHGRGYVHRDIKPSNFRVGVDGQLYMIDVELAHALDTVVVPYGRGTPGFMSPQQQAEDPPSIADDVYGFGAVALYLFTGIHPLRIVFSNSEVSGSQVCELALSSTDLTDVVARALAPSPEARPRLGEVEDALTEALDDLDRGRTTFRTQPGRTAVRSTARKLLPLAAEGLLHDVCLDSEMGLWLSQVPAPDENKTIAASDYRFYRSANRGVAGVVYFLARFSRNGLFSQELKDRADTAIDWLLAHHPTSDDQLPGLHFGEAGVALAVAEAIHAGLIERGPWFDEYLTEALGGPIDWPDLTHGAAGQGIAALCCADIFGEPGLISAAERCARFLVDCQDADGGWTTPPGVDGLSGARLTGFAHGVAGIVYFLAEYSARTGDLHAKNAGLGGADWLVRNARTSLRRDVLEWPTREGAEDVWRWWCHGSPGIALAWLKLFERYGDRAHADLAVKSLRWHPRDVRHSNLSVCHGLSGLGEIYLEAARVLENREWLARAEQVGHTLIQLARPGQHGVVWLAEDGLIPTADLMVGCSGIAHFLLRLGADGRLSFPLLP